MCAVIFDGQRKGIEKKSYLGLLESDTHTMQYYWARLFSAILGHLLYTLPRALTRVNGRNVFCPPFALSKNFHISIFYGHKKETYHIFPPK